MSFYVHEYFEKKALAKIGYRFNDEDLTSLDVEAFNLIAFEINRHEANQAKKNRPRKR